MPADAKGGVSGRVGGTSNLQCLQMIMVEPSVGGIETPKYMLLR